MIICNSEAAEGAVAIYEQLSAALWFCIYSTIIKHSIDAFNDPGFFFFARVPCGLRSSWIEFSRQVVRSLVIARRCFALLASGQSSAAERPPRTCMTVRIRSSIGIASVSGSRVQFSPLEPNPNRTEGDRRPARHDGDDAWRGVALLSVFSIEVVVVVARRVCSCVCTSGTSGTRNRKRNRNRNRKKEVDVEQTAHAIPV